MLYLFRLAIALMALTFPAVASAQQLTFAEICGPAYLKGKVTAPVTGAEISGTTFSFKLKGAPVPVAVPMPDPTTDEYGSLGLNAPRDLLVAIFAKGASGLTVAIHGPLVFGSAGRFDDPAAPTCGELIAPQPVKAPLPTNIKKALK